MNCIIIEDQPPAQRILKKFIEDMRTLTLCATFSDALQAMEYLQQKQIDLIFLDIHLPKISGIDFLKTMPDPPKVVLTTAYSDYALESYELDVVDYLLKPFSFQRFVKAVNKVQTRLNLSASVSQIDKTKETELFIKSGHEHVRILIQDIVYIHSDADYTEIYLKEKKLLSSESLRYWEEKLDQHQFVRIHKSFIINASRIDKIVGNQVYLNNKTVLPVGRAYKDSFRKRFVDH
ncbi:LytTR family DNA-binding domain-containing protein [Porifericola rhodea]|uniref:LytR/AlgR family response regulator transcription factor n=1 Tax=Porifericola rhodea TaxID=930972 RepID=UPI0026652487|nr:LytTR family DNA-binding domain-containing protein [Porifericola rhodea]WKN29718.1 LytTR family DNA-binding domain-containing protein [Porifericola rhodea]